MVVGSNDMHGGSHAGRPRPIAMVKMSTAQLLKMLKDIGVRKLKSSKVITTMANGSRPVKMVSLMPRVVVLITLYHSLRRFFLVV